MDIRTAIRDSLSEYIEDLKDGYALPIALADEEVAAIFDNDLIRDIADHIIGKNPSDVLLQMLADYQKNEPNGPECHGAAEIFSMYAKEYLQEETLLGSMLIILCHSSDSFSGDALFSMKCDKPWKSIEAIQHALSDAVLEYARDENISSGHFTWWDVLTEIPDSFWEERGFTVIPFGYRERISVSGMNFIEAYEADFDFVEKAKEARND